MTDLGDERKALDATRSALDRARDALAEAADALGDTPDGLSRDEWHADREARERAHVTAQREVERLTAAVEHAQARCLTALRAECDLSLAPVREQDAAERHEARRLYERLAEIETNAAEREHLLRAAARRLDLAEREFLSWQDKRGREENDRQLATDAQFVSFARDLGLEIPVGRVMRGAHGLAPTRADDAARAEHRLAFDRETYPNDAARAAGVSRLDEDTARLG